MKSLERFWHGCGHCDGADACPMILDATRMYARNPWFQGYTLVGVAVVIFLLPLACAVGGGFLLGHYWPAAADQPQWGQVVGVFGGLLFGALLAKLIIHLSRISRRVCPDGESA